MTLVTVFYPLSLGLFFYIWWKGYHWGWGALIVAAIIIFDPIWIIFVRNLLGWKSKKH
ncbi:hypothetical protein [Robiginitomaculum antarcticum]|uniref:hypothetical protein n=1 Tax=Robiginitomaculum antarcticum TaxID=437507 RepID=UPI0003A7654C|nr:hypothetical protein [Robiginitomaculum antarcticum]